MEIIEKNNVTIALTVLCAKKEKIYPAYVSKNNVNCEKQVIPLMIPNEERCKGRTERQQCHYLAVKKLSVLLTGITSKHHGDFYCLHCLNSFATEKKLESHKKVCENKDFYNVTMPFVDTKMLEFDIKNLIKHHLFTYADPCII